VQQVFNFGQLLISLLMLHFSVTGLGQGGQGLTIAYAASLLVGGLVFFAVNTTLVGVVIYMLSRRRLVSVIAELVQESYIGVLGSLGLLLPLLVTVRQDEWPFLVLNALGLLAFRYAVNLYLEQKQTHLDSLTKLSLLIERKTGALESHAVRVANLARAMAEAMKLPADLIDTIYAAGVLHDVGEAEVDPRVVSVMARKAIPTLADLEAYRQHPVLGENLVGRMEGMAAAARLIRHHHEAWDGSGYPDGLRGDAIALGARILAAVEAVEGVGGDLEAKLAAIGELTGSVIAPGLVAVLEAALRKCERPVEKAAAIMEDAGVTMLQSKLLQTVRSSQLLETMGVGRVLSYEHGVFTNFLGTRVSPPARDEVIRLADQCLKSQLPARTHAVEGDTVYDVYSIPAGESVVSLLLFDVTQALAVEREQTRRIFRAYRDVISVATQNRLLLIDNEECHHLLAEGSPEGEVPLVATTDGHTARVRVDEVAQAHQLDKSEAFHLKVCASEAITNVFKHAGKGTMAIRSSPGFLRIVVSDRGDGIPFEILPQAVLREGYSTKRSLGKGFTIMLRYLDRVLLHTSAEGTVMVLEKKLPSHAQAEVANREVNAC